jgi:phosphonate transport system substrate-binding protein
MKKWISVIILAILVFSLAACGQSDEKTNEGKKETTTNEVFKLGRFLTRMQPI